MNKGIPTLTGEVAEEFVRQADENYKKSRMNKFDKDFRKYYWANYKNWEWNETLESIVWLRWGELPFSMQWGVYLAFFDSVGMEIGSRQSNFNDGMFFGWVVEEDDFWTEKGTRQEAQKEAIEKAKEIYNSK